MRFERKYTVPGTETTKSYPVNVDDDKLTLSYSDNNESGSAYITGIIATRSDARTAVLTLSPKFYGITQEVTEKVRVYVDSGEDTEYYKEFEVTILPASEYTLVFENDTYKKNVAVGAATASGNTSATSVETWKNIKLYYKAPDSLGNGEGAVRKVTEGNKEYLYTLYKAKWVDQYPDDPGEKAITQSDLQDKIRFVSDADNSENSLIKVKGFNENLGECTGSEEVAYIGITIADIAEIDNEDELLEKTGNNDGIQIKVYQSDKDKKVVTLNIKSIEKRDITTLNLATDMIATKTVDYRYSVDESTGKEYKPNIIAQITSGAKEKDLTKGMLTYTVKDADGNNVTNKMTKAEELETDGIGRINLRLRSPDTGTYTITASLGSITRSWNIEIKEDPRITKVKFRSKENGPLSSDFGDVANSISVTREIVYYHVYSIPKENINKEVKIANTDIPRMDDIIEITSNTSGLTPTAVRGIFEIPGTAKTDKIQYINVLCDDAALGSGSFNIKIKQKLYDGRDYIADLTVQVRVVSEITMTAVGLTNLNGGNGANLYYPGESPAEGVTTVPYDGKIYTIFKIWTEDSAGQEYAIKSEEITDGWINSSMKVLITADNVSLLGGIMPMSNISIQPFNKSVSGYKASTEDDDYISYIGIALEDEGYGTPSKIYAYLYPNKGWINREADTELVVTATAKTAAQSSTKMIVQNLNSQLQTAPIYNNEVPEEPWVAPKDEVNNDTTSNGTVTDSDTVDKEVPETPLDSSNGEVGTESSETPSEGSSETSLVKPEVELEKQEESVKSDEQTSEKDENPIE